MKRTTFSPRRKRNILNYFSVTFMIIAVNVITFILFSVMIALEVPIDYIAIKPLNILSGNYLWTFITSMFMHGGFFHLFVNMFSLFFLGGLLERILGPKRYFGFYMISGLFAALFFVLSSLVFTADLNTFAVGASGALFGLVGLLVLLTPNLPVYVMLIPVPIKMKYAGPGILVLLWFISIAGNVPIGNTAHLGGLVAGVSYGIYLRKKYKRKTRFIRNHFK